MNVALIGYGEVGQILAEDLGAAGHSVATFDPKLPSKAGNVMRAHAHWQGVTLAKSHAAVVRSSNLVISAVTPSQTLPAAEACADGVRPGTFFLDLNSASPGTKVAAAAHIARRGGRYVEGAVTSVSSHRIKVPLLLGGPNAAALLPLIHELGFCATVASDHLGDVSATTMCRGMIIEGLQAMVIESLTAARRYGVEGDVLASLRETFPGIDWDKQAAQQFEQVIAHGRRRSEEMREAVLGVREAGLEPWIATGAAERQAWIADLADEGLFGKWRREKVGHRTPDWRRQADRILDHIKTTNEP